MPFSSRALRISSLAAIWVALLSPSDARLHAALPATEPLVMYILPLYRIRIHQESDANFAAAIQAIRAGIGEGARVRVGFTTYMDISMDWTVDPADAAAVRASLAPLVARIDAVIAKARANDAPVAMSFLTAIRGAVDPAQALSRTEDVRVDQWHADGSIASGWWTLSRYARRQIRLREAYIRELGRVLATRMAAYPSTLVAATGDGEVELSYERAAEDLVADYSPFAAAEFRDWLRGDGLYDAGQPYAGQAYAEAARYHGDASPGLDTNNDSHTVNGDFGTSFTSWNLRHFDWTLTDAIVNDPHAIPASAASAPGWNPLPGDVPGGFDPPRTSQRHTPWWDTWDLFRATMVWRHNQDFARWITTSPDPGTGATVPVDRWFTDQIPADYLYGGTPDVPNPRLFTSASPWWTADVSPYGSIGLTAFNIDFGPSGVVRTLVNVAPFVAARNLPWALTEWNPSLKSDLSLPDPPLQRYRDEIALIEQYRPRLVMPLFWDSPEYPVNNSGFETALHEMVERIKNGSPADTRLAVESPSPNAVLQQPFTLAGYALDTGIVRGPGWGTGVDLVHVEAFRSPGPGIEAPIDLGTIPYGLARSDATALFGSQFTGSGFSIAVNRLPVGVYDLVVSARSTVTGTFNASQTIRVTIAAPPGVTPAPFGVVDTPAEGAIVAGELPVTGWALDDHGIAAIDVYRNAVPGESSPSGLIFVGTATRVRGARPDLVAAFPTLTDNDRAGWGLMVLSNMFPFSGNGIFTLTVVARDLDGQSATIGTRVIDARNAVSRTPFGTIDTPPQGATISGSYVNFGWALTPPPNNIPIDGSTIDVYIDGLPVGKPVYNLFRADIAALFPGYANTNGAVGYYVIDTTQLANGVHTIAWVARDSAGNATGMGSRFFTVAN